MKKLYKSPIVKIVVLDDWRCIVCESVTGGVDVTISDITEDTSNSGFTPSSSGAPRRKGPWDE